MADDIATVEQIYKRAGLALSPAARGELEAFMTAHPRGKEGRVVYNLERDFGISPDALRERFAFYFDRFPAAR